MFVIRTHVGRSAIHGTGVFASEDVAVGATVWRFHPGFDHILSNGDIVALPKACQEFLSVYAYRSKDLEGQLVLSGDHARFLNHSNDPNTEEDRFVSVACKPIRANDEITCDYRAFCTDGLGFDDRDTERP